MSEREDLIQVLARQRGFLLFTAEGLTEEQARAAGTVSSLTIAGLLKHVADTEEQWMAFSLRGAEAFTSSGVYESDIDWEALDAEAEANDGDWSGSRWQDDRFTVTDEQTLDFLRTRVEQVAAATERILRVSDLDSAHALPEAPWFEQGESWSVRKVAMHVLAEISQHAGHADIIREAIDGQKTMG